METDVSESSDSSSDQPIITSPPSPPGHPPAPHPNAGSDWTDVEADANSEPEIVDQPVEERPSIEEQPTTEPELAVTVNETHVVSDIDVTDIVPVEENQQAIQARHDAAVEQLREQLLERCALEKKELEQKCAELTNQLGEATETANLEIREADDEITKLLFENTKLTAERESIKKKKEKLEQNLKAATKTANLKSREADELRSKNAKLTAERDTVDRINKAALKRSDTVEAHGQAGEGDNPEQSKRKIAVFLAKIPPGKYFNNTRERVFELVGKGFPVNKAAIAMAKRRNYRDLAKDLQCFLED